MTKIVVFGEILARFSTKQGERLAQAKQLQLNYGGAEANVAISLAQFGHEALFVSKLPDHALGKGVTHYLKSLNVSTAAIQYGGERLGTYYLEVGAGNRGSQVVYDRKFSSFSSLTTEELDHDAIFENAYLLHVTGITPALSSDMVKVVEHLFSEAKSRGVRISFDFNYRAKLWSQKQAGTVFKRLLPYIDICSCGELDLIYLLDYPKLADELSHEEKLRQYYRQLKNDYPNLKWCMSTQRENISASQNRLTGYLYADDTLYQSEVYHIDHIIDRVGGGDAFVAGILHGLINKWKFDTIVSFATAASVLKHTVYGDANLVTEAEVINMLSHGHQISR
ncbi:sugar kinase [Amphibacillus cookii]|uniref:sugar kinase n=1 Tax=Amphibacillus cookii TaxID=767787 RepID=UPI00195ABB79|nr:sugar kinase [Amphibacillus cookii]MBM7541585.1 2-dehydro-3-deoxygluconokinase [Amphibacillus cookii]